MKISIVTPSYNQAQFIERTILSILDQHYPDLEYIVMDGGSTDGTLEILKKYSDRIIWKSEPDSGQSQAINKGLKLATGEVVAYLNSDDCYAPGTLQTIADFFNGHADTRWVTGQCRIINQHDHVIRRAISCYKNFLLKWYSNWKLLSENFISQPATFWRRAVHTDIGYFNEQEHFCMDYEFWLRLSQKYQPGILNQQLADFRYYPGSKSGGVNKKQFQDELRLARQFGHKHPWALTLHAVNYWKIMIVYRLLNLFD